MTSTQPAARPSAFVRAMILITSTVNTAILGLTLLVVSVVLPKLQGALSATPDQIAWVVTFNIIATAVATPMSGWLAARFGRRNTMLACSIGFAIATAMCAAAESLEALVFYRVLQGALGAPLNPLSNAVILSAYPKEQHGRVNAIYGMGVVIGPALGPIIGGVLTELYGWRWAFLFVGVMSAIAVIGTWLFIHDDENARADRSKTSLDWTGFLALSFAIVCLQLVLDRGNRADWFQSTEIVIEAGLACAALYVFIVHCLTAQRPFLDLRLLLDRNYSIGLLLVLVYGMMNFTPMVLLPPMLQGLAGYPDDVIGGLVSSRGAGAFLGFILALAIDRVDPRIRIGAGFLIQAASGWMMMQFDVNVTALAVTTTSMMQGLSVGLIWVPLVVTTFSTIDRRSFNEAAAVFHLFRYIGSSIFISLCVTVILRDAAAHHERLGEWVTPYNDLFSYDRLAGLWSTERLVDVAMLGRELDRQAQMLGYLQAFGFYAVLNLAIVALVLLVKSPDRSADVA
ncbi:MAG: DHA2 family efflux MFS transporter permease subunit [Alphaproteobacteria bacterium]